MADVNCAILAIAKDEGAYLLDWIAFHISIGFERIYLYDNESNDCTREILQMPGVERFVEVTQWPNIPGRPRQALAYDHWLKSKGNQVNWVMPLDVDEYLNLHFRNSIGDFLDDYEGVSAIGFNWRIFGDNGLTSFDRRPIFQRFTMAANSDYGGHHIPKSICHVQDTLILGAHTPKLKDGCRFISPDGVDLLQYPAARQNHVSLEKAQVNHYFGKTWEEWVLKRDKGMVDRPGEDKLVKSDSFFHNNNRNDVEDSSILRFFNGYLKTLSIMIDTNLCDET